MNSEDFVTAISRYVKDAAIEDTIANLKSPPGRRVPPAERIRSDWYNALPAADAAQVTASSRRPSMRPCLDCLLCWTVLEQLTTVLDDLS